MPRTFTIYWLTSPTAALAASQLPAEPPTAFASVAEPIRVVALVFRVGDFEVGDTFCSRLYGHPGIRY